MTSKYDNMVHINLQQDTLLSLRLLDNQYNYASKDRVPPIVALKNIASPTKIAEKQRLHRKRWGLNLHKKAPKLCPRLSAPPHSARLPLRTLHENERQAFIRGLKSRRKIYKTSRTAHCDITPRFPEEADRLLGQPVNLQSDKQIGPKCLSSMNNIFQGDRSCILGKSTKKANVSALINEHIKKETYEKYDIERIAKTESNRIRARKEKYPFLYDDEKPVPARMQTGERALIQRVQKMMVENCR